MDIFIFFCQHFNFLPAPCTEKLCPSKEFCLWIFILRKLWQLKYMNLEFVGIHVPYRILPDMKTRIISLMFKQCKIQNPYMDTFLQLIIIFPFVDLVYIHFPKIKQRPLLPVIIGNRLHFNV